MGAIEALYKGKTQEELEAELQEYYANQQQQEAAFAQGQETFQGQLVGSGLEAPGFGAGGYGGASSGFRVKPPMASDYPTIPDYELPNWINTEESAVAPHHRIATKLFLSSPSEQVAGLKSFGYDAGYSHSAGQPFVTDPKTGKRSVLDPVGLGIRSDKPLINNVGEALTELGENVDLVPEVLAKNVKMALRAGGGTALLRQIGREVVFPESDFSGTQAAIDILSPQTGVALQGSAKGVVSAAKNFRQGVKTKIAGVPSQVSNLGQKVKATGVWQKAGAFLADLPNKLLHEGALARDLGATSAQLNALKGRYIIPDIQWLQSNVPEFSQVANRLTVKGRLEAAKSIYDRAGTALRDSPIIKKISLTVDDMFDTPAYKELVDMAESVTGVPKTTEQVKAVQQQFMQQVAQPFRTRLLKKKYTLPDGETTSAWEALESGVMGEGELRALIGNKPIRLDKVLDMRRALDSRANWGNNSLEIPESLTAWRTAANSLRTATRDAIENSSAVPFQQVTDYINANDVFHHMSPIYESLNQLSAATSGTFQGFTKFVPSTLNGPARTTGLIMQRVLNDPGSRALLRGGVQGAQSVPSGLSKMLSAVTSKLPGLPSLGTGDSPMLRLAGTEHMRGTLERGLFDQNPPELLEDPTARDMLTGGSGGGAGYGGGGMPSPEEQAIMQIQQQFPSMQQRPDGKTVIAHPMDVQKLHGMTISMFQAKQLDSIQAAKQISAINALDPVTGEVEVVINNFMPKLPEQAPAPQATPLDQLSEKFSQASPL